MLAKPDLLLRIEDAALLVIGLLGYRETHSRWLLFAVLLLVPDISLAGYLAGVKIGAAVYNLAHTMSGPFVIFTYSIYSILTAHFFLLPYGLIWSAHTGMDRMLGFGLKHHTRFNGTHLQRI